MWFYRVQYIRNCSKLGLCTVIKRGSSAGTSPYVFVFPGLGLELAVRFCVQHHPTVLCPLLFSSFTAFYKMLSVLTSKLHASSNNYRITLRSSPSPPPRSVNLRVWSWKLQRLWYHTQPSFQRLCQDVSLTAASLRRRATAPTQLWYLCSTESGRGAVLSSGLFCCLAPVKHRFSESQFTLIYTLCTCRHCSPSLKRIQEKSLKHFISCKICIKRGVRMRICTDLNFRDKIEP